MNDWQAKRAKLKGDPMPKGWLAEMRRIHARPRCAGCDAEIPTTDPPGFTIDSEPVCEVCCGKVAP